jgi:hypothetical protein
MHPSRLVIAGSAICFLIISLMAASQASNIDRLKRGPAMQPFGKQLLIRNISTKTRSGNFVQSVGSCRPNDSLKNLTRTPGNTLSASSLKIDSGGTIHIAYFDERETGFERFDLFYIRSIDGGKNFSAPIRISNDESIHEFIAIFGLELVISPAGDVCVVWSIFKRETQNSTALFARSIDQGRSFSTPLVISSGIQNADNCKIMADRDGNVLVTFFGFGGGATPSYYMVRSPNRGENFSSPALVTPDNLSIGHDLPIAFDSNGAAYAVYHDNLVQPATVNLLVARNGVNFTESRVIVGDAIPSYFPHIAIDRDDNLYIAYHHEEPNEVLVIKSTDGGLSFGSPALASSGVDQLYFPYLIADPKGNINVVMLSTAFTLPEGVFVGDGDVYLSRSTDGGLTFSEPANVSCSPPLSILATGAADDKGNVFVSWIDEDLITGSLDLFIVPLVFPPTEPDFALIFNPATVSAPRGSRGTLKVNLKRVGGFSSDVRVKAPNTKRLKIKISPSGKSTTGKELLFNFKIDGKALPGANLLTFTGRDDSGRARTGTLTFVVE